MNITNSDEYALALARVQELVPLDPERESPEGQELTKLSVAMETFETDNFTPCVGKWNEHYHTLTQAEQMHIRTCIENGDPVPVFDKFVAGFASLAEVSCSAQASSCSCNGDCACGFDPGVQSPGKEHA